jgi:FKBP-type peptidyl-prolyl cis-trans isomerase FkpA
MTIVRNSVLFLLSVITLFSFSSCLKSKNCSPKPASAEASQIQNYAATNGISATAHPSGLYYEVLDPGSGATPTLNSKVVITYTGKFFSGSVFDKRDTPNNTATEGADAPWPLKDLIEGWRVGLPLIQKGGHIRLLIPSSMAYGCNGYGAIPGDAILDFDITLVDVIP